MSQAGVFGGVRAGSHPRGGEADGGCKGDDGCLTRWRSLPPAHLCQHGWQPLSDIIQHCVPSLGIFNF